MEKKTLSNFLNCLKIDDIGITEEQFEKVKERLLFLMEPILTEDIDLVKHGIDAFNQKRKEEIDKLVHRSDKRDTNWKPHPIEIHKSVKEDSLDLKDAEFKLINIYEELSPEDKKLIDNNIILTSIHSCNDCNKPLVEFSSIIQKPQIIFNSVKCRYCSSFNNKIVVKLS